MYSQGRIQDFFFGGGGGANAAMLCHQSYVKFAKYSFLVVFLCLQVHIIQFSKHTV